MLLKFDESFQIEDLRHHPAENVSSLRELLLRGAEAHPDPHRSRFYEVDGGPRVFYIHISPGGKVLLLAVWAKEGIPLHARAGMQMTHSATM